MQVIIMLERLLSHLRHLAETIGPRGSTTQGEREAADYIEKTLQGYSLQPERQPFRSIKTFSWLYLILYGLFPVAAMIYPESVAAAALISLAALGLFLLENNSVEALSRLLPTAESQNVLAKVKGKAEAKRVVVVSAHYDSSRSALNFRPDLVKGFRTSFQWMVGAMVLQTGSYLFAMLLRLFNFTEIERYLWILSWPGALYLTVSVLMLVHRETYGRYTHGANDNAAGVSVMLEVAREMAQDPCQQVDVWCLATGCEEAGTVGMIRFLDDGLLPIKRGDIINLDNLGSGQVKIVTGEGMTKVWPCTEELVRLGVRMAREENLPVEPTEYRIMPTDAQAALVRGYRAVSIMAMDENGLLPNWHWITDTVENVQPANLTIATRLVLAMIREIDRTA